MKKKRTVRCEMVTYFLCFSLLLSMSGYPSALIEAKELGLPIGHMVSRGEVKFEAREKVWKSIVSSHFPIFPKGRIQTVKGTGIITLENNCQIEIDQNSMVSMDQMDRLSLSQGKVSFRIPAESGGIVFRAGNLSVTRTRTLQAAKSSSVAPAKNEEIVGSISIHPNGSVTVRNLKGSLSVLDQDHTVLASLSAKESITVPSVIATGKSRTMVAQAGEVKEARREQKMPGTSEWEYLGLNAVEWIAVGYAALLVGGLTYLFWPRGDKDREEIVPLCP